MKNIIQISIAIIIALISLQSCQDDEQFNTISTYNSVDDFLTQNAPKVKSFVFDNKAGGTFTTNRGSIIDIEPETFVFQGILVDKDVELRFKEVFTRTDMIYSGIFPSDQNQLLNSGGEFYVSAVSNGQYLDIAIGKEILVSIPSQAVDPGMEIFLGGNEEIVDAVVWQSLDTATIMDLAYDQISDIYSLNINTLQWINVDVYIPNTDNYNCNFQLKGLADETVEEIRLFLVFEGVNSATYIGMNEIGTNLFNSTFRSFSDVSIVAIAHNDKTLYTGVQSFDPEDGKTISIDMEVVENKDKFETRIESIP